MPYSNAAKDAMLAELATLALYASAHETNPGSTGADEASGSTRAALTWGTPSAGSVALTGTPVSITSIPAIVVVNFIGLWTASTAGTWLGYQPIASIGTSSGLPWTLSLINGTLDLNAVASA